MEFKDRDEAKIWIIKNQLGRRNLHELDQAALLAEEEKIEAKNAQRRNEATRFGGSGNISTTTGKTRDVMGAKMGVSGRQYDKLKAINEKATERTKQLVREGKLSINQAYSIIYILHTNHNNSVVNDMLAALFYCLLPPTKHPEKPDFMQNYLMIA